MSTVEESTPELAPFMTILLNMSPTQVVYNDMRQRITLVHHMASLPQGACTSTDKFNVTHSGPARTVRIEFPTVLIVQFGDDNLFIGSPRDTIRATVRLRDLLRTELGLHPASTTLSKNSIYSMGEHSQEIQVLAQENDLYWIDKADGMEVVGSPVSSLQYQIEFVNRQADKIIDELT